MSITFTDDTLLTRREPSTSAMVEDNLVMMDMERGNYYGLGEVGTTIWTLLATPHTLAETIDSLVATYAIDRVRCREDIIPFLTALRDHGLLECAPPAEPDQPEE